MEEVKNRRARLNFDRRAVAGLLSLAYIAGRLAEMGIDDVHLSTAAGMTAAGIALLLQAVGAVAVPIIVYLAAGAETGNIEAKHVALTFFAALAAEVPYDLLTFGTAQSTERQNPIFGICLVSAMAYLRRTVKKSGKEQRLILAAVVAAALLWSVMIKCEGGVLWVILGAVMQGMKKREAYAPLVCAAVLAAVSAFSPLYFLSPLGVAAVYGCHRLPGRQVE